jgi:hypothetical protein
MSQSQRILVFDLTLCRPACVLLQAALGGSPGISLMFPAETWLVGMTPNLKAYAISEPDLKDAVESLGGIYEEPKAVDE